MQLRQLLPLTLAGIAAGQGQAPSLVDALGSQNASLSSLNSLLQSQPELVSALGNLQNITILAPSNDALSAFLNNSAVAAMVAADPSVVAAVLSYHVLNGTYYASNITETPAFVPTLLMNETYTNVTGGQVVEAMAMDDKVMFFSALKENSTVVTPNVNFTGGTIHIIDKVLTIPMNITDTAIAANLTAVAGAIEQADVGEALSSLRDVTIFAPSNSAFGAIANLVGNLSTEQLGSILQYHVINGTVAYSSDIMNGSVTTLGGEDVKITVENGTVFVNSAKVILPDVLIDNGVVHVIDNVLNPMNTTASADPSASTQAPAFSGASSASNVPFTSGVPTPSSTAPAATGATGGSSSSTGGVPMRTAAVGAAALFGGAAMFANL